MTSYPMMYQMPSPQGMAMGNSMGYPSGMMGYGGGMPGSSYGAQGGMQGPGYQGYGGATVGPSEAASEAMSLSEVLAASGVPNDGGRLRWPVGLRVVGGPAADKLRQQVETLFQQEAGQAQTGPVNPHLAQEAARSVDALRQLLLRDREERFSVALTTYEDAEHFLVKLEHAQKVLEAGLEPPGGKAELKARAANVAEVALYENRFEPPMLTVAAGTTVRWTNRGGHQHTVTSDKGDWGSAGLAPAAVYSYTFTHPGEYPYHCEVHPREMRGTVVVK
jgi:plastocyanin